MSEWLTGIFLLIGGAFSLLAAVGVLRMPDLFTRMHAATKSGTLGVGFVLLGAAVYFGEFGITTRTLVITAFFFFTAPVAAHMIARAAYSIGEPMWKETRIDELAGHFDPATHTIKSCPLPPVGPAEQKELSEKEES